MAGSEALRHRVFEAIEASHGTEVASDLMELLPPAGVPELATKHDLALLEARLRGEMHTEFATVRAEMERLGRELGHELREQTNRSVRWMLAGMGFVGLLSALGSNALHLLG